MIKVVRDPAASEEWPKPVMKEVADHEELARGRAQRERFRRNLAWLNEHGAEIFPLHRGKVICIAGEELFVADTAREAVALAAAAHPEDDGRFVYRVPREGRVRI
jgi:hypothetical protein